MRNLFRHHWISTSMIVIVAFLGVTMWLLGFPVTWVSGELLFGVAMIVGMIAIERDAAQGEDS
jgi:hypothetical protein